MHIKISVIFNKYHHIMHIRVLIKMSLNCTYKDCNQMSPNSFVDVPHYQLADVKVDNFRCYLFPSHLSTCVWFSQKYIKLTPVSFLVLLVYSLPGGPLCRMTTSCIAGAQAWWSWWAVYFIQTAPFVALCGVRCVFLLVLFGYWCMKCVEVK